MIDTHVTKDGVTIRIQDMGDTHLQNTIRLIERRAKEGLVVRSGGGYGPDDFWYEEEILFGTDVLIHLNYSAYVKESLRRANGGR